jgi:hypothetical protein
MLISQIILFQIKMTELTFVDVEETVELREECAEEDDPLDVSLSTKGKTQKHSVLHHSPPSLGKLKGH